MSEMEARITELQVATTTAYGYHLDYCPHLGIYIGQPVDQLADSLGALSVNDTGDAQYFGPTAGAEVRCHLFEQNRTHPDLG